MNNGMHRTDPLLATVERLSDRLGPLSSLIDGIVERIVPKAIAKACGSGYLCYTRCLRPWNELPPTWICWAPWDPFPHYQQIQYTYSYSAYGCSLGDTWHCEVCATC